MFGEFRILRVASFSLFQKGLVQSPKLNRSHQDLTYTTILYATVDNSGIHKMNLSQVISFYQKIVVLPPLVKSWGGPKKCGAPPEVLNLQGDDCSQSSGMSGKRQKREDAISCTLLSQLSVSKRVTSAANICLARHAEESSSWKTAPAAKSTIICASGDADLCPIQQVNNCIIAPGLLAHHSFKAVLPRSKMHLLPQGSTINPNSTTVTTVRKANTLNSMHKHNESQVKRCVLNQYKVNKVGSTCPIRCNIINVLVSIGKSSNYWNLSSANEKCCIYMHLYTWFMRHPRLCPQHTTIYLHTPWTPAKTWKWSRASDSSNSGILRRFSHSP